MLCSRLSSGQPFSTTTRGHFQKITKDEPFSFSKSKARSHTVDESLGISQPSSSKFPLFLGLGLFGIVIYVSFFRHESKESTQTLEEILEKMRTVHEENQMKSLQDNKPDNINNEINTSKN